MTTTERRHTGIAGIALHLVPAMVLAAVFAACLATATIAPSRAGNGVYEITVGPMMSPQFVITTESLDCRRDGNTAVCGVTVAGQPLVVRVTPHEDPTNVTSSCTASYGELRPACMSGQAVDGHRSVTVRLLAGLDVDQAEVDRWRQAVPWWRVVDNVGFAWAALTLALGLAAAIAVHATSGRAVPLTRRSRTRAAVATGVAALALFSVSALVLAPDQGPFVMGIALAPPIGVAAYLMGLWQWHLASVGDGRHDRLSCALGGAVVTVVYVAVAAFMFMLLGSFVD